MNKTYLENLIKKSNYAHLPMNINPNDEAGNRWKNKKVFDKICLYHSNSLDNVILNGQAKIELSDEYTYENEMSLKFTADTKVENVSPRPFPTIKISLNKLNLNAYNRITLNVYPKATGHVNFYFHFVFGNKGEEVVHAPSLNPNEWNMVTFEVDKIKRDEVETFTIQPFLMGCPPEGLPELEVYVSDIFAEKVEADDDLTWELNNRIAYCHSGYYVEYEKTAIVSNMTEKEFKVFDEQGSLVLTKEVKVEKSNLGTYLILDFTEIKKEGLYKIVIGNLSTKLFEISNNPLDSSIWKSMNFLRMLRCGEDVPSVHSHCHLNCKTVDSKGRTVPNFGGWHDAGDLSQFEICTAEMAEAIAELAFKYENTNIDLYNRLKEEAKVGLIWLLRTRFGNGERALAVSYSVWRDNVLAPDNESIKVSKAENGPFENLLSASALAVGTRLFEDEPIFSDWCKRAAVEDYKFGVKGYEEGIYTLRWGPNIDSQVAGIAMKTAVELYLLTNDNKYLDDVEKYGKVVLSCQEQDTPKWDIPMKGFFYEDPKHSKILTYEHRGHEQNPIHGLARAYEVLPNHKEAKNWKKGLELYAEYALDSLNYTKPYNLLPAHVYPLDKINIERFTVPSYWGSKEQALIDLKEQAKHGIKLNEDVYLRIFPVAIQRRGYHATLLSKTKAVSLIGRVLNKKELLQVAYDQLAWILGKNPFSSSTMYGEGHNYHPLYVAFSPQLVGALPVGFKTYGHLDVPYWPTVNNAVFKEIWGHTTGKYLWILADM
ncbi:MAG: glycoside hydrolase family 9 protein [Bacilli bacterium]|nr:glycoside hydrolase family 9 protein [Bacilli bacterium]